MARPFPNHPLLQGIWEPWPMEGDLRDLPVVGEVPQALRGTFYRNGPNPQFAPRAAYHLFDGDGMIHAFAIEDGKVHYRNRWVRTPRFEAERAAGESLYGGLASPTKDDPRVAGVPGGPANTHIVSHAGKLLALVELGLPPVELDPVTLATRGVHDFEGELRWPVDPSIAAQLGIAVDAGGAPGSFTAHPKEDPRSGELLAFGRQRRLFVNRVFEIGFAVQRRTEDLLVMLEVLRRVLDEQSIARLERDRRQLGEEQRIAALDLVDTHLAVGLL